MLERIKKNLRSDLWIVLLDIIAVNGAYLLALLIRFYVHFRFTSGVGDFREYYLQFTPYYTVLYLIVFYVISILFQFPFHFCKQMPSTRNFSRRIP